MACKDMRLRNIDLAREKRDDRMKKERLLRASGLLDYVVHTSSYCWTTRKGKNVRTWFQYIGIVFPRNE